MKTKQTKLRTVDIKQTLNISFPIGPIQVVKSYSEKLNFSKLFGSYKKRGRPIIRLVEALMSYKLIENLSISKARDWINQKEILSEFDLKAFEQRTLFRCLEILGKNYEEIISDIQDTIFKGYNFDSISEGDS